MSDLKLLDHLLSLGYDRRQTPTNHMADKPTVVDCQFFLRKLGEPNPITMQYTSDVYFRQHWIDERLQHENMTRAMDLNDPNLVRSIWKPEVYFLNAEQADFHFVTVPNVLLRIYPNGQILYMLRLRLTFSCIMDLSRFPMDTQTCTMEIASFSKTIEELILRWKENMPITIETETMGQFKLANILAAKCHQSFVVGDYSCLKAEFHLVRLLGYHMVQSFLPTPSMVVISFVAFWMDVNEVSGRVTLGITTLLTVSSEANNIGESVQTSYVKAIDLWMGACMTFVFMTLLESIVVNYLWRVGFGPRRISDIPSNQAPDNGSLIPSESRRDSSTSKHFGSVRQDLGNDQLSNNEIRIQNNFTDTKSRLLATHVDKVARILFPIMFSAFVISYWTFYLYF